MAWEADVKALKMPVLIIAGDADVATLEHSVAMFRLLGGGVMGDMGKPLAASRLAVMPATSHTAVITQPELLHAFIEPFLKGSRRRGSCKGVFRPRRRPEPAAGAGASVVGRFRQGHSPDGSEFQPAPRRASGR